MSDEIEQTKCNNPLEHFPSAVARFKHKFVNDLFGSACGVHDHLWFAGDLTSLDTVRNAGQRKRAATVCHRSASLKCMYGTCREALLKGAVARFTTMDQYVYLPIPAHLILYVVEQRLIAPHLPFISCISIWRWTQQWRVSTAHQASHGAHDSLK